jgi:serine/threonine protein kinase
MQHLQAARLPRNYETPPDPALFDRLTTLIGELHDRGVGHGDLRRMNILVDDQGRPYLIDFETAVTGKEGFWGWFSRFGARRMARIDRVGLARIKQDFYPDLITPEEKALIEDTPWYLHVGYFFKRYVYRLKKPHHRARLKRDLRRKIRLMVFRWKHRS